LIDLNFSIVDWLYW